MAPLVVLVEMLAKPGAADRVAALLKTNAAASRGEPGCRRFDICADPARPERRVLYEIYDDEAAFAAHLNTAHYRAFAGATADLLAGVTVQRLQLCE
jgi:autoinducer 2-degrading protein